MTETVIGNALPAIRFFDDMGRARNVSEFKGSPTILVPIYARCHGSCPKMANSLKNAILKSSVPTGTYRVVLFSFDSRDTTQDLQGFRKHESLPIQWTMAGASEREGRDLMESIGFRYTASNGEFLHPNVAAVVDSRLRVTKLLSGENYTPSEIEQALGFASGKRDLRDTVEPMAFAIALLLLVLSTGYLLHLAMELLKRRRRNGVIKNHG